MLENLTFLANVDHVVELIRETKGMTSRRLSFFSEARFEGNSQAIDFAASAASMRSSREKTATQASTQAASYSNSISSEYMQLDAQSSAQSTQAQNSTSENVTDVTMVQFEQFNTHTTELASEQMDSDNGGNEGELIDYSVNVINKNLK